jgi:enoyl-CoA hydratase
VIDLEARDGVAWLYLNRPQALNALNRPLTAALGGALDEMAAREDVRVLILAGRGRAFCAGNDLAEMAALSAEEAVALARSQAALMERFGRLPQVTIAAVEGYALGGGCMLALAQDLRIASDRARFGLPEVTLGFNPAYGIARLLEVAGGGAARDLLLTGRTVRAQEALRLGLVNRVVAAPTLAETAATWAREIAGHPREGLAAAKRIVADLRAGHPGGEPERYAATLRTGEAQARLQAFRARHAPRRHPGGD